MISFSKGIALVTLATISAHVLGEAPERCDAADGICRSADTDAEANLEKSRDNQVITQYLFSTPLIRAHISAFTDNTTAFNAALSEAILQDYETFLQWKDNLQEHDAEERNDNFFVYQTPDATRMSAEEVTQTEMRAASMRYIQTPEFKRLRAVVSDVARHVVKDVLRRSVYDEDGEGVDIQNFQPWAAVHYKRTSHGLHFHEDSALAAVYYVSVPEAAGELTLYDPRGPRPPFEQTYTFKPREGELIMFPGWLGHSVGMTGDTHGVPRISIPFNSDAAWEWSSDVPGEEFAANAADVMTGDRQDGAQLGGHDNSVSGDSVIGGAPGNVASRGALHSEHSGNV